jgi:hypothetical protein
MYLREKLRSRVQDQVFVSQMKVVASAWQRDLAHACIEFRTEVRAMNFRVPETIADSGYSIAKLDLLARREYIPELMRVAANTKLFDVSPAVVSGPWPPFSFLDHVLRIEPIDARDPRDSAFPHSA